MWVRILRDLCHVSGWLRGLFAKQLAVKGLQVRILCMAFKFLARSHSWSSAPVLKTGGCNSSVGSNPTLVVFLLCMVVGSPNCPESSTSTRARAFDSLTRRFGDVAKLVKATDCKSVIVSSNLTVVLQCSIVQLVECLTVT